MSTCTETIPIPQHNYLERYCVDNLLNPTLQEMVFDGNIGETMDCQLLDTTPSSSGLFQTMLKCRNKLQSAPKPFLAQIWQSCLSANKFNQAHADLANVYTLMLMNGYQDPEQNPSSFTPELSEAIRIALRSVPVLSLRDYVNSLVERCIVNPIVASASIEFWNKLQSSFGNKLPEPDAAPSGTDALMLALDHGLFHIEFETTIIGTTEVFLLNRATDDIWETEIPYDADLPKSLLKRLEPFLQ